MYEIIGILIGIFAIPCFLGYLIYLFYNNIPFPFKNKLIDLFKNIFTRGARKVPREMPNIRFEGIGRKLGGIFRR